MDDDNVHLLSSEQRSLLDKEVQSIIEECTQKARELLRANRQGLERLKDALMEYETISGEEIKKIIKGEKIRVGQSS
jgi:ATP-dependent Zn protease